ncbi:MAG: FecR domain-containing protein [Lachnospiraceae bacterium]
MKEILKTTKGKAVLGAGVTGIAVAAVTAGILLTGKDAYRTISVEEVNGTSIVQNEKQESNQAYEGMHLMSGDDVKVEDASDMTLLLDMDKYVYAEENTHFWLEAEGDSEKSKTRIYLDEGAELNRLSTKLTEGESYEVETPNSVMAVRGTVFRVSIYYDENGVAWTQIDVYDGEVEISLKTLEGDFNGEKETFKAGQSALIRAGADYSEFVMDEENHIQHNIDYEALPQNTVKKLLVYIDDGQELCISRELLLEYAGLAEQQFEETAGKEEDAEETTSGSKETDTESEETDQDSAQDGNRKTDCEITGQHTPGAFVVTKEATCTQEGVRTQTCTVCGKVILTESIPMKEHVSGDWTMLGQDLCNAGGEKVKTCIVCGATLESANVSALGHDFSGWSTVQEPGCTEGGIEIRVCSRCGGTETTSTGALGHDWSSWETIGSADCTSEGQQTRTCNRCGETETVTISASGHDWSSWEEQAAASCETEGSKSHTCSRCGKTETATIAALGHEYKVTGHDKQSVLDFANNNSNSTTGSIIAELTCTRDGCQHTSTEVHTATLADGVYCETCQKPIEQ